jgi:high affinity sulfate transporter 1
MATDVNKKRGFPVPLLEGVLPVGKGRVPAEVIAGVTLAALAIPEVMGYAKIAGMPVVTGLYTILIPMALFAVLGSSRHLVVGADSATAAIMFAALTPLAAAGSPQYVALAGMLAIIAGACLLLARILRLGFLANFLSRTVLIGFLTGVGIQVACGQLAGMFGYAKAGKGAVAELFDWAKNLGQTSFTTLAVSAVVLAVMVLGGRLLKRVPWALIAVVGAIVASAALSLSAHGVSVIGAVPGGLPHLSWPGIPAGDYAKLATAALSIFVVILAQSAATSRAYAAKFEDDFDENVDLVGLGVANLGAGLTGAFVVNGSPTKTAMVDDAGGRSQLAQLVTVGIVLVVLVLLTKPLSYLPEAVLASVVFLIAIKLIDVDGMRTVLRRRPVEFGVALATTAIVVVLGVEQGIVLAILLSIVAHLRHSYTPYDRLLVRVEHKMWKSLPLGSGAQARPGLLIYRFGSSLYYANASRFADEVRRLLKDATEPVRWFCLAGETMDDLDFTGSTVLARVLTGLTKEGITFVACDIQKPVLKELERDGLLATIGAEHVFGDTDDVIRAYKAQVLGEAQDT